MKRLPVGTIFVVCLLAADPVEAKSLYIQLVPATVDDHTRSFTIQADRFTDKADRDIRADWRLYTAPRSWLKHRSQLNIDPEGLATITRVDVWLGDRVQLRDLVVPPSVAVKSAGDIETFIRRHEEGQKAADDEE